MYHIVVIKGENCYADVKGVFKDFKQNWIVSLSDLIPIPGRVQSSVVDGEGTSGVEKGGHLSYYSQHVVSIQLPQLNKKSTRTWGAVSREVESLRYHTSLLFTLGRFAGILTSTALAVAGMLSAILICLSKLMVSRLRTGLLYSQTLYLLVGYLTSGSLQCTVGWRLKRRWMVWPSVTAALSGMPWKTFTQE